MPLRVLQVNSLFSGGGTDNQTLELAAGLRELGVDVTLAVPLGSRWEARARATGMQVETLPPASPLKLAMVRSLAKLLRERRIDILHAHQGRDYWPSILAARLARRGTRVVVSRHLMTRPRTLSRWLLLRSADVVAVSCAVEQVLRRELHGPRERLHQLHGGIDTRVFAAHRSDAVEAFRRRVGWDAGTVAFGVVGAFDAPGGKGQREFFEAAAQLAGDFPLARFAIIGKGTMEASLRALIQASGLAGRATIIPFTEDVVTAMGALDVLVHPAVGTEALGLVLWEAMASGKPVIASRLGGIPEAFVEGEHGMLVSPGDVAAIAWAMRALLVDPELRSRLGAAGPAYVCRNFSRRAQAERVLVLYRQICGGSHS